ncbi:MAG: hypothetical protein JJU29_16395 [Verrucomicrobia bacterium]|nr:hypothetical protein [Verrucomicrobiota bacterium]MCH8513636.1 hypothetical protein [Kiritimatiellia bacterium]
MLILPPKTVLGGFLRVGLYERWSQKKPKEIIKMKITFRGWKREVTRHEHAVAPVTYNKRYSAGGYDQPLKWYSANRAYGKVQKLSLGGDFLIEIDFTSIELVHWLDAYIKEHPKEALRLLTKKQSVAIETVLAPED